MTGAVTVVDVQWALYGKDIGSAEERVLACSTGDLSTVNFADAISRFTLGTLHSLPQVSVSYAQTSRPGRNYLALAIHKPADRGQAALGEDGRPITYTNYFCLPYAPLAGAGVSYRALHDTLRRLWLPTANGPPMRVTVTGQPWPPPAIDQLAMRVAALLLTSRSVCVLHGQDVPLDDRLGFIDTVMTLLPYGFRAKMTAATWTRATYRDHRFRLFFSDAPRAGDRHDYVVSWGRPESVVITPEDGAAHEYLTWLEETVIRPIARLSLLTDAYGFGDAPVRTAIDLVTRPAREPEPAVAPEPAQDAEPRPWPTDSEASGLRSAALAFWRVREARPKRLARWFASGQVDAVRLVNLLAGERDNPRDARVICDLTMHYLETMQRNERSPALRQALRQHGFLAQLLAADGVGDDQYQVTALVRFLTAAYPDGIGRPAIMQVLAGEGAPPTPALLAAVLTLLVRPKDAHLAREAYVRASVARLNLDHDTSRPLADRLPLFDYDPQDPP